MRKPWGFPSTNPVTQIFVTQPRWVPYVHIPYEIHGFLGGVWLSVWWFGTMEFYDFAYIGNFILPTDELIFFRWVQTTNQITWGRDYMINDGLFVIITISWGCNGDIMGCTLW